ncbi:MAG: hypothetical protein IPP02_05735 [Chitinophagaceae bacterium]|nr:hypothetical protein [Chitinophagaceae bacterium]MBK7679559.1 hypothetical protein [Chitinophagaceae bacterium]MBK8299093.1 hypothetical protein [Chitinophagaceae bacterium]MBK9659726.1 hypothetical protein [Chitinophagaceae bacterium]MBK9937880.1 hypothetical protein [Chitinophagaceae bacterium]
MKKLPLTLLLATIVFASSAQDTASRKKSKTDKKDVRRQKINTLIKQSEEGVLIYSKQSIFGLQGRTNGFGAFYEIGRMKSNRKTNTYRLDFTEIKHQKEEKSQSAGLIFSNPYIYGKINHFYQATLGFGQQYILGQKGNKNGVAVSAIFNGGLALGLLRPYYVDAIDPISGETKTIRYSKADSSLFLGPSIIGGGGFGKGWNEIKMKPGGFVKTAMRFDYGRFNEVVSGIEVGLSIEFYGSKIPIMVDQKDKQMFFQGYISILFGRRK